MKRFIKGLFKFYPSGMAVSICIWLLSHLFLLVSGTVWFIIQLVYLAVVPTVWVMSIQINNDYSSTWDRLVDWYKEK